MNGSLHIVCPHCDAVNRVPQQRCKDAPLCGKCHKALFLGEPLELNARRFQTHVARNDLPVVVDFWAPWCGPCKAMAPALVVYSGGKEIARQSGALSSSDIVRWIEHVSLSSP